VKRGKREGKKREREIEGKRGGKECIGKILYLGRVSR